MFFTPSCRTKLLVFLCIFGTFSQETEALRFQPATLQPSKLALVLSSQASRCRSGLGSADFDSCKSLNLRYSQVLVAHLSEKLMTHAAFPCNGGNNCYDTDDTTLVQTLREINQNVTQHSEANNANSRVLRPDWGSQVDSSTVSFYVAY